MGAIYDRALYDLATPGTFRGDLDWYRKNARESGGPVLELGAGTGRVTLPIARDGAAVCALDVDSERLGALRRKLAADPADVQARVTIVEGDMRTFRVDRKFPIVIAPFRVLLQPHRGRNGRRGRGRSELR